MAGFAGEGFPAGGGEGVKLCVAVVIGEAPFSLDPAILFEFVKGGIKGAFADVEDVGGDGAEALAYGPAVEGFEGEDFEEEEVEGALKKVGGFTHIGYRDEDSTRFSR